MAEISEDDVPQALIVFMHCINFETIRSRDLYIMIKYVNIIRKTIHKYYILAPSQNLVLQAQATIAHIHCTHVLIVPIHCIKSKTIQARDLYTTCSIE